MMIKESSLNLKMITIDKHHILIEI